LATPTTNPEPLVAPALAEALDAAGAAAARVLRVLVVGAGVMGGARLAELAVAACAVAPGPVQLFGTWPYFGQARRDLVSRAVRHAVWRCRRRPDVELYGDGREEPEPPSPRPRRAVEADRLTWELLADNLPPVRLLVLGGLAPAEYVRAWRGLKPLLAPAGWAALLCEAGPGPKDGSAALADRLARVGAYRLRAVAPQYGRPRLLVTPA
jgi:hypothetical protein